ncbi:threonine-phosphate decarboxylase CobD [Ammonifex thiophilus]|uniref:threonine-phosphate decarboxylase n=1 Tax=Ammonifex thiophilus TaxID=444093 RepID=A0A3D8P3N8_9THEO|nr:threonine-phosphate decarboxylase CobD [Ammonifex thiophilus]RDV83419.1 threonine-phosphate decarboxylase [Ammonifex thiophilus]
MVIGWGFGVEHGGNIFAAAAAFGGSPEDYLDFSSNVNPLGPPAGVLEKVSSALPHLSRYPDPECGDLCQAVADYLGVEKDWLFPGNGTAELIYLLVYALGLRRVLIVEPTFSEYARAVEAHGGHVKRVFLSAPEFEPRAELIRTQLDGMEALFICHPNNPTGKTWPAEELALLAEETGKRGVLLIVDEAFIDFLTPEEIKSLSAKKFLGRFRHLILLYSLTKFFGLAGLRLGFLIASPEILARVKRIAPPWRVNFLAQLAGVEAVKDRAYQALTRELVSKEKAFLERELGRLPGFEVLPGQANFLLVRVERTGKTAKEWTASLARRRILVRDASNFPGLDPYYIRVAVKKREDNLRLLAALKEVCEEYGL